MLCSALEIEKEKSSTAVTAGHFDPQKIVQGLKEVRTARVRGRYCPVSELG